MLYCRYLQFRAATLHAETEDAEHNAADINAEVRQSCYKNLIARTKTNTLYFILCVVIMAIFHCKNKDKHVSFLCVVIVQNIVQWKRSRM